MHASGSWIPEDNISEYLHAVELDNSWTMLTNLPSILKRIFRQISSDFILRKNLIYTHDIYYIHYFLSKFYPEYKELWDNFIQAIINKDYLTVKRKIYIINNLNNFIKKA